MPEFRMPSLGADMEAGTLLEWLVKPGDVVHRGDVIAVVDTDKAAIEVECFDDGVVGDLIVHPGQKVPVGAVLATIGAPGAPMVGAPPTPAPAAVMPAHPSAAQVVSPLVRHLAEQRGVDIDEVAATKHEGVLHRADIEHFAGPGQQLAGVRASPMARRLAAEAGLDLAALAGTGTKGAITAQDVRRALATTPEPAAGRSRTATTATMRQAIAALMTRSNREIPHYYLTTTIDMSAATGWLRNRNRDLLPAERLVPAALLLAATARAAREVPQLNGTWTDGEFHPEATVNLGVVVSLRRGGILVPAITDAGAQSVEQLMASMRDLVGRARTGTLRSSQLAPPSITVSNLGDQGVDSVLGVIYPPQVALVGFGALVERPWAVDGLLGVRPVVTASLAADHRASDGAVGARFLNRIERLLQKPEEL
jgi:pyruvate dehydrogenase E2 component (dihydrolipoamide acetyltransferase)